MNNRDRNFTKGKIASRIAHLEADVERYITEMVRIDRQEEGAARAEKVEHLSRRYGRIRHFLTRRLKNVRTEMALNVLAYNIKRMVSLIGIRRLMAEIPG